ncbi:hypothetical protein [Euzebya sp.]|uniref:DUF6932 family protein n=1 Tax=Euzebya sp. TaxID=1971409 RepID=UPI00351373B0
MPLPEFDDDGMLPPGLHRATVDEVRAALVEAFTTSTTRTAIHSFWQDRRAAVREHVDVVGEWLDGSFTSDKPDPADLDLITIIDGPSFDAAPRHRRQVVASLVAGTTTEAFWACDANVLVHYPDDDLAAGRTAVAAGCWAAYFGHTREGRACGIVELLEDGQDGVAPALEPDDADDPEAQLEAHLARFDHALQAFDDPEATERPGLRLMAETLRLKRDELAGKLESSRRVELVVAPRDAVPADAGAMATVIAAIVAATPAIGRALLADAEADAAADIDDEAVAAALRLRLVGGDAEDGSVVLRAADPADRRRVPAPDDAESLVTAALLDLLAATDGGDASPAAVSAADDLRTAARVRALPVALTLHHPFGHRREVDLDI